MNPLFTRGLCDGIPIALGYLSVSFGFGIMAVSLGLPVAAAVGISISNLTSAGQVAGVGIIAAGGTLIEMLLAQLVINIRYSLMAITLSQKLDADFRLPQRLLVSFGITDEIFAVAHSRKGKLSPIYMYGLILISVFGWVAGTFIGAAAGSILPEDLISAMGIVLYAMFLAIILPPARKERGIMLAIIIAAICAVLMYYVFDFISAGFAVIISAVIAAAICAFLFPAPLEEVSGEEAAA